MSDRDKAFGYAVSKWGTSNTPARENLAFADGWKAALDWTSTTTPSPISDQAAGEPQCTCAVRLMPGQIGATHSQDCPITAWARAAFKASSENASCASTAPTTGSAPFANGPGEHPEDVHLDDWWVDLFAKEMKEKLANARAKGRGGWQDCSPAELSNMLREHVEKGDPRDVANFCMFLWALRSSISIAPPVAVEQIAKAALGDKYQPSGGKPRHDWLSPTSVDRADLEADDAAPASPAASVLTDADIDGLAMSHCYELIDSKLRFTQSQWRSFARALLAASMGGDRT